MASYASGYNWLNTLQSITREGFVTEKVIDTVFKSNKFFQYLRQKGKVDDVHGSLALTWNVNTGTSPNTIAFDGDTPLPINSMNTNIIRASLDWKKYADALVLLGTDLLVNDGSPEAVANLVDVQLDITKMSLVDKLAGDVITNTQALNALQMNGLAEAVDDSTVATTYAGISRATYGAKWKSTVNYNVVANILNALHSADLAASIDGQRPDAYFTNTLNFGTLIQSLFSIDRYNQPDMARTVGGTDLIFNGNPVFLDQHVPTAAAAPGGGGSGGLFYGLNSSYLKLVVHPQWNFATGEWREAESNLSYYVRCLFAGNLVVLKPSANFVAWIQGG